MRRDHTTSRFIGKREIIVVTKGRIMGSKAGRKRKQGHREANGRLQRSTVANLNLRNAEDIRQEQSVVLMQPHRRGSEHKFCESVLGRFCLSAGCKSEGIVDGVEEYAETKRRWSIAMGRPRGTDNATLTGSGAGPDGEVVKRWFARYSAIETMLCVKHGIPIFAAVHKLAYDREELRTDTTDAQKRAIVNAMRDVALSLGHDCGRLNPYGEG